MSAGSPPWEICWEHGFDASLRRMGITREIFNRLGGSGVEFLLRQDPYEPQATFTLGGTKCRYIHTRYLFADLPAMVIAFTPDYDKRLVRIEGAEPVWDDDLDPYALGPPDDPDWRAL